MNFKAAALVAIAIITGSVLWARPTIDAQGSYPPVKPPIKVAPPPAPPPPPTPVLPANPTPNNSNPEAQSSPSNKSAWVETSPTLTPIAPSHSIENSNIPVRPPITGQTSIWIRGDALFWQAAEENLTYVATGFDAPSFRRTLHNIPTDWEWGFRLDAGYDIPHDRWDIELKYTQMHNHSRGTRKASTKTELFSTLSANSALQPFDPIAVGKGKWNVKLNQVDLLLGREYLVGRDLSLRPNAGVRSTWIFQKLHVFYRTDLNDKQEVAEKSRFWGFGFVAGLDTDWRLGGGFSLYGDTSYSLLLGFFDNRSKGQLNDLSQWDFDDSFRTGKAIFDLDLGLKWTCPQVKDTWAFCMKAGYEYHLYFDQNQFLFGTGSSSFQLVETSGGNLTYQGISLSAQLNF